MSESSIWSPMREPVYRRIWSASLLSNFGLLIQGVGAAWAMTQLTTNPRTVALVQSAAMLPMMIGSIPAGAVADMFDKRKVAMLGLLVSLVSAGTLCGLSRANLVVPWILLLFCFLVGTGYALFSPAWQSSTAEQVGIKLLPQAIALNAVSYNLARSFGPAIGGIIVAAGGPTWAFLANAMLYIPLLVVLYFWRRSAVPSRLPPERITRAVQSGLRYVAHSPGIRVVVLRTFLVGLAGASISSLMPLIARDKLSGTAFTYGLLLGAFGIGAVVGALMVSTVREHLSEESAARTASAVMGVSMVLVAYSRWIPLTTLSLVVAGAMWMLSVSLFNIAIQTKAPRWVAGRSLAAYQAAVTGGIALGGWLWGSVAMAGGITLAMYISAAMVLLLAFVGLLFPIPSQKMADDEDRPPIDDPDIVLPLTLRSGPIVIEIEYHVDPNHAREYYGVMQDVQKIRQRNGAYDWSLARDLAHAHSWSERFYCPTWLDYLHMRSRTTRVERETLARAALFNEPTSKPIVRRMLERPVGSVRWKEAVPDSGVTSVVPMA